MIEDLVPEKTLAEQGERYYDGLFRSHNGKGVTRSEMKLDHRILETVNRIGSMTEGQLASYLGSGLRLSDERFQNALARLESFGYVLRKKREWGLNAAFVELADDAKKLDLTPKGRFFGAQTLAGQQ
jgi:hypothetical protein